MPNLSIKQVVFAIVLLFRMLSELPAAPKTTGTYDQSWKRVDSLLQVLQPESALKVMEAIYNKSKIEHLQIQQIKAFVGIQQIRMETSDEVILSPFRVWETELSGLSPENKSVLLSYQGEFMVQLFNRSRSEIFGRTKGGAQQDDITTWDVSYFKRRIDSCFLKSLDNHDLLSVKSSRNYTALLATYKLAWNYRPTLLDLVAAKALEFYRNDGFVLSPVPLPWVRNAALFSESFHPEIIDNGGFDSRVFYIFDLLEKYHQKNGETEALFHLKLERMDYIYESSLLPAKDELFISALKVFENRIGNHPFKAEVMEKQADVLSQMANKYNPLMPASEIYRMKNKEAVDIYRSVIKRYKTSPAGTRSANKLSQMQLPQLQLTVENIVRKGLPFAVSVQYRNLTAVKAKLFRVNQSDYLKNLKSDQYNPMVINQKLKSKKLISEKSFQLVQDSDYRSHSTELIFPKLNSGLYFLDLEGITGRDTCTSFTLFTVSGISFNEQAGKFNILDIENGVPVTDAVIEIYSRNDKSWESKKYNTGAEVITKNRSENNLLQIVAKTDTITMPWYTYRVGGSQNSPSEHIYLFTDRSIYRPGQTVFFKGILFNKDNDKVKSVENKLAEVVLLNSNYQGIDTLKLTTNRYGTVTGKFKIPTGGLSGRFSLRSENGNVAFQVEEYRRPGFKIAVDDLKGEYRIDAPVGLTGNVSSFSGVPLKNVTGKYRISRNLAMAFWSWGEPEQIAERNFVTDAEGKYRFNFLAKPDERYSELKIHPYRFEVEIEITDITGETQKASKSLDIRKEALTASLSGSAVFDLASVLKKEVFKFSFKILNSDKQEINSKGKIELVRLKSPEVPLRRRLWTSPDRPVYTKTQWNELFPGNQYDEEVQPINYGVDKVVQTIDFEKDGQRSAIFNIKNLEQGYYKVIVSSSDQFGLPVKAEHLVRVFDSAEKIFLFPENSWVNLSQTEALPGQSIELLFGNFGNQFWNVGVHRRGGSETIFNGVLNKAMEKIAIPIEADDQGGLIISISSMNLGISYHQVFNVNVPWVKKELKLTVEDFPETVIPGKEVSWKVRVVDSEGNPVKAEVAGVVYDASLDKILPHNWQLKIWESSIRNNGLRFPGKTIWGNGLCSQPAWITERQEILPEFRKVIDYQVFNNRRNDASFMIRGVGPKSGAKAGQSVVVGYGAMKKELNEVVPAADLQIRGASDMAAEDKPIEIRSDFRETAWFNALFETDVNGRAEVRFNLPGSVTEWKFMALAHTPDGLSGRVTDKFVTRKPLMVEPFPTRFLTAGDEVTFPVKVTNLSGKSLSIDVEMVLINMETGKKIESASRSAKIMLADGKSEAANWKFSGPATPGLYQLRVTARADGYSDGFESILPVEPDRTWTTESKAFTVKPGGNYSLDFRQLGSADQLNEGKWNLTMMTNPVGLILDALPQLMGSESVTISGVTCRLNGALILRKILTDHPEIGAALELQRNKLLNQPDSFKTRLEKAEQFTNLKLDETPWLRESVYEREKLAKFNPDTLKTTIAESVQRLEVAQQPDGGFAWCPGMESSEWMTVQILNNIAQMRLKNLLSGPEITRMMTVVAKAVIYLDGRLTADFRRLKEKEKISYQPGAMVLDYLEARSAFSELEFARGAKESWKFYLGKASANWTKTGIWQQVQLAFVLKREGNDKLVRTIVQSLEERAIKNSELGMYWKQPRGFYFYREPDIALQGKMIELFNAINAPAENTDALKLWLLQQKRTHAWDSPFATAQAVYALMDDKTEPIGNQPLPELLIDGKKVGLEQSKSADGFIQLSVDQKDVRRNSKLVLRNKGENVIFGGVFHGYFKQVNDTSRFGSSLKIRKEIFKLEKSVRGDSLVSNLSGSRPGDLLMVRLLIENDRDLGFISLDDQRPAGTEPLKQLSSYEYNGGLWYYRVNQDAGTRFFIGNLPKGRFVLEYPVRVSHMGTFSGGRVNIQCSFAPEFGANHSPGKVSF